MSLLIDALKQAEAQRRQAQQASDPGLRLEPLATPIAAPAPVGEPTGLDPVDPPAAPRATPARAPQASPASRAATREVFAVKEPGGRHLPLIVAGVGLLALALGAAYVWWSIQPRGGMQLGPALASSSPSGTQVALPAPPVEPAFAPPAPAVEPAPQTAPPSSGTLTNRPRENTGTQTAPASTQADTGDAPVIALKRGGATNATPQASTSQRAYQAYQDGHFDQALTLYREALRQEPRNTDVLDALATLALRAGRPDEAERMLRQSLSVDPRNAYASAQLALIYGEGDSTAAESRLRSLVAAQPESAAAHFALGSLLARQARWREAQQSFFQAHTLDVDNPDFLYNLAISLDQLQQLPLARQFYQRALAAAAGRSASFDPRALQTRLQTLSTPAAQ
ncbi:tetratricopeptide repeat protein [Uliginosibacterium sp. H1]|uniref:tetratricopeptide repeat protein n=1 Tax=Uliginosibacterium sp. H1 TaxID=3114757 RepID=UPI002E19EC7D|nr:tetratricopeptide repeat protein [Uliginosibacterium sp. H1]